MPTGFPVNLPIFFKDTLLVFHITVKSRPVEDLGIPRLQGICSPWMSKHFCLPALCSQILEEKVYFSPAKRGTRGTCSTSVALEPPNTLKAEQTDPPQPAGLRAAEQQTDSLGTQPICEPPPPKLGSTKEVQPITLTSI